MQEIPTEIFHLLYYRSVIKIITSVTGEVQIADILRKTFIFLRSFIHSYKHSFIFICFMNVSLCLVNVMLIFECSIN